MAEGRDAILARWLAETAAQPFHQEHTDRAVADHIPALFDALTALLRRERSPVRGASPPLDDAAVAQAATMHAQARFAQGLAPVAVVTEFRLLRHEIARALIALLDHETPAVDVVAGLALVGDALDGASSVGLAALSGQVETLRESFLATTLHDVRQPITLVEGSLHLADRWLGKEPPSIDKVREAVSDALLASAELVVMVDLMSDASRVAMGALEPDLEPVSLSALVRDAIGALGTPARQRIVLDAPLGLRVIGLWDQRLLRRLVANILSNALKYSPATGSVLVTVATDDPGWARLETADSGIGMTADEIGRAFDRFVRADRHRSDGIPGLGLGLYACRGIVAVHGGTIEIESPGPDQGTTVTVRLPLADAGAEI